MMDLAKCQIDRGVWYGRDNVIIVDYEPKLNEASGGIGRCWCCRKNNKYLKLV